MASDRVKILVVEDEPAIMALVTFTLKAAGWQPVMAETSAAAWHVLERMTPDLILLDWMLPDESGIRFLARLRENRERKHLPVIMLTARSEEDDRVRGLDKGADDYVTKPFSTKELVARINAVLRRKVPDRAKSLLKLGSVTLDPETRQVTAGEAVLELGNVEFRLLRFFLSNPERVFSRYQILDRVWPNQPEIEERTVDVHVLRLRKAMGDDGYMIRTVRGVGYMATDRRE
ncbi:response regulator [Oxalobacter sp. OttesenSCG-928-P03]|nr:response regulator [Oxalobacter sp. OttesenSCG-928-P03]